MVHEVRAVRFTRSSHCHVMWCPLVMGIVASQYPSSLWHCAHDLLPHIFNICIFKCSKDNSTTITYLQWIWDSCDNFDSRNWGNLPYMIPVIGMENMVTCASLSYTQDYLTPGICSLIKPTAVEKLMSFPATIHTVSLQCVITGFICMSCISWINTCIMCTYMTISLNIFSIYNSNSTGIIIHSYLISGHKTPTDFSICQLCSHATLLVSTSTKFWNNHIDIIWIMVNGYFDSGFNFEMKLRGTPDANLNLSRPSDTLDMHYCQTSNIRCTKSQNLDVSHLVLQLSLS